MAPGREPSDLCGYPNLSTQILISRLYSVVYSAIIVSPTGFEHGGGVVESPSSLGYFNKATAGRAHTGEGAGKIVPEILDILQTH